MSAEMHSHRKARARVALASVATAVLAASIAAATMPARAAAVGAQTVANAAPNTATVVQPRSFGHVLGDVLTQRILLEDRGRRIELTSLPVVDRVDRWFERRASRIETDDRGRRWLVLDYQLVNAPRALAVVSLPALLLPTRMGNALRLDAWPLSVGPLTPQSAFGVGDLQPLRPDRPVAERATEPIRRQLVGWLCALVATCATWLVWAVWRNRRDAKRFPFARGLRQLQDFERAGAPNGAEAWLAMHRALDAAAGRVVHADSLPRLFTDMPELKKVREELEHFFRRSSDRFFARSPTAEPFPLIDLARALCRIERRTQR